MSIVSRTIEYSVQHNSSKNVTERHLDHLGNEYTVVYVAAADADLESAANKHADQILISLAEAEASQILEG